MKCTGLITAYNEGSRLKATLTSLTQIPEINQWIVLDDCSSDNSFSIINKQFPQITFKRNQSNLGKTRSIASVAGLITTPLVFLADADLRFVIPSEYSAGITSMTRSTTLDMLIFRRIHDVSSVYSGERILKTEVLLEALKAFPRAASFQLEAALNQYCLDHQKYCAWFPVSTRNTYQVNKVGFLHGWQNNLSTIKEIIELVGPLNYLKQLTKIPKLQLLSVKH